MNARYRLKVDRQGRMVLPAAVRAELGIEKGGELTLDLTDDDARLTSHWQALRRIQQTLRRYVPEGVSLSDELIADRRAEVAREEAEAAGELTNQR